MGAIEADLLALNREPDNHVKSRFLRFNPRSGDVFPEEKRCERVLLLQGPVGPFFKHLRLHLEESGLDVWRVCFNAGDRAFSRKKGRINFYGDSSDWKRWFSDFIVAAEIDCIILFGAERLIHSEARAVAADKGIDVLSLEEGYIRPGYITIEWGGNNASSPLVDRLPPSSMKYHEQPEFSTENFKGFQKMCAYGTLYYMLRQFFSFGKQKHLMHRHLSALPEIFYWLRNVSRRILRQSRNFLKIEQLLEHNDRNYYLVPLQVAADTQMQVAAAGWNQIRLISSTLKSFAQCAPAKSRLVFKIHPLERGHCSNQPLIIETAAAYGIQDRVDIIDSGSLGLLTRHAAGMITINSTSGLSAIYHGIPLLAVGDAFYAHPDLVVCASGNPDFDAFWSSQHVADHNVRRSYFNWIKREALMVGDFYSAKGINTACQSVLTKLQERKSVKIQCVKKRSAC